MILSAVCFVLRSPRGLLIASLLALSPAVAAQEPAAQAGPSKPALEQAGISAARLKRLDAFFGALGKDEAWQGAVLTVSRRGQNILSRAVGDLDAEGRAAMPVDAVFDLSLLTEPVTAAAALALQEQGKWVLTDSLDRYLPAFEAMPVTLWQALAHTSGLTESISPPDFGARHIDAYTRRLHHSLDAAMNFTGERFVARLAGQAPARSPGLVAQRSFSYDVLGLAMEKATGQTLGTLFLRSLFIPLDMWDTGFNPSASLETRLVLAAHSRGGDPARPPVRDLRMPVSFECAGACLTGTAADYHRFASMLLNEGKLDGQRVLSRPAVAMMTSGQLAPGLENRLPFFGSASGSDLSAGGRGLGVDVFRGAAVTGLPLHAGDFGLTSPSGSFFWVSPAEQLIVVMLGVARDATQVTRLQRQIMALVYQTIDD